METDGNARERGSIGCGVDTEAAAQCISAAKPCDSVVAGIAVYDVMICGAGDNVGRCRSIECADNRRVLKIRYRHRDCLGVSQHAV